MEQNLLIEVEDYSTSLLVPDDTKLIDFKDYEEQLISTEACINLYIYDEEIEENKTLVATIKGRYLDIEYAINHGISLYDVFDEIDADTSSLTPYLLDEDGDIKSDYFTLSNNIYYLDRIEVKEKYRGKGYAKLLLKNLEGILSYVAKISVGIIVIQAQPYDIVDGKEIMDYKDTKRKERLIQLYETSGYQRIGTSNYLISVVE